MTTPHARWEELAAGHALNALEPEDEHAFLDHLRGCDRCRDDLSAMQSIAAQLAYAADYAEPPAELGRRILDAAAAERPAVFPAAPAEQPGRTLPFARPVRADRIRPARRWQPSFRITTVGTAAALVAVVALGAWNVMLRADSRTQQQAIARRTAALRCLSTPDAPKVRLRAENETKGSACVTGGRTYLMVDRLAPTAGTDRMYVLWWQDATNAVHAVEGFDVPESGTAVYEIPLTASPGEVRGMAVSLERGRQVPAKPTVQIAAGTVEPDQ